MSDSWSLWSFPGPGGRRTRVRSWVTPSIVETIVIVVTGNLELREDSGHELREDGGFEVRE